MSILLHPAALQDLEEAATFYAENAAPAVAARFLTEFDRIARLLHEQPAIGAPRPGNRRGFPTAGFPHTIIYRETPDGIRILVIKHDRRRPGYGGGRR